MTRARWEIVAPCPGCTRVVFGRRGDMDERNNAGLGPWCFQCGGTAVRDVWRLSEIIAAVQMLCPQNLEEEALEEERVRVVCGYRAAGHPCEHLVCPDTVLPAGEPV